ncbi:hypothetical protein BT63DRAFT_289571 [Microthyrium microscopicum]|uniref:Uncharacterized protein n=1 Tax=Microthyrium microscopicum TaxID=703497 RepID=A0A6A6U787_9PEZI|nr:hypothetical protein BT63DRAFT_289571 [Microthyrium microscopicum]
MAAHHNSSSMDSEMLEDSQATFVTISDSQSTSATMMESQSTSATSIANSQSDSEDDYESDSEDFPYSTQELATMFEEFYQVLTTLHFESSELRLAPPGGWPHMTDEFLANFKSPEAMDVVRHLPYFHSSKNIHYKSKLIDFSSKSHEYFVSRHNDHDWRAEFYDGDDTVDPAHAFCFAAGFESYGREFTLDVKNGTIIEDMIRAQIIDPVDVSQFLSRLAEDFRSLRLLYCPGREMLETDRVDEVDEIITEEQWRTQSRNEHRHFGTDLDIQYLRQVYRKHGWPDAFRKEECWRTVGALMDSIEGEGDVWEEDAHWEDAEDWE